MFHRRVYILFANVDGLNELLCAALYYIVIMTWGSSFPNVNGENGSIAAIGCNDSGHWKNQKI
jgi:hypothetical protein